VRLIYVCIGLGWLRLLVKQHSHLQSANPGVVYIPHLRKGANKLNGFTEMIHEMLT